MPSDMIPAFPDSVRVTDEDREYAVRQNQFNCMIVRAIQRKYPRAKFVRVNKATIAWSVGEARYVYPTPETVVETMIKPFDQGQEPKTGLIRLDGGVIKPVIHREDEAKEAKRRWQELQYKTRRHNDNEAHRSDYERFPPSPEVSE